MIRYEFLKSLLFTPLSLVFNHVPSDIECKSCDLRISPAVDGRLMDQYADMCFEDEAGWMVASYMSSYDHSTRIPTIVYFAVKIPIDKNGGVVRVVMDKILERVVGYYLMYDDGARYYPPRVDDFLPIKWVRLERYPS